MLAKFKSLIFLTWLDLKVHHVEFIIREKSALIEFLPVWTEKQPVQKGQHNFILFDFYLYLQDPSKKPPLWFETENIHIQETGIRELTSQIDLLSNLLVIGLISDT